MIDHANHVKKVFHDPSHLKKHVHIGQCCSDQGIRMSILGCITANKTMKVHN